MESPREDPRLPLASLLARPRGLILLTGCRRSPVWTALQSSAADGEAFTRLLVRAFGPGNVFVELQDNAVKGDARRNRALARLAGRMGLGVVATGDVHYHRPDRSRLQDVLVSIRNRTTLDGAHGARRPNHLFHLPEPWEMRHRFREPPRGAHQRGAHRRAVRGLRPHGGPGLRVPGLRGLGARGRPGDARRHLPGRDRPALRAGQRRGARRRGAPAHRARASWTCTAWRASSWSTATSWTWRGRWPGRCAPTPRGRGRASRRDAGAARRCRPSSATSSASPTSIR